jgi:hypothetical protein
MVAEQFMFPYIEKRPVYYLDMMVVLPLRLLEVGQCDGTSGRAFVALPYTTSLCLRAPS